MSCRILTADPPLAISPLCTITLLRGHLDLIPKPNDGIKTNYDITSVQDLILKATIKLVLRSRGVNMSRIQKVMSTSPSTSRHMTWHWPAMFIFIVDETLIGLTICTQHVAWHCVTSSVAGSFILSCIDFISDRKHHLFTFIAILILYMSTSLFLSCFLYTQ